jgi:hypothetical protein
LQQDAPSVQQDGWQQSHFWSQQVVFDGQHFLPLAQTHPATIKAKASTARSFFIVVFSYLIGFKLCGDFSPQLISSAGAPAVHHSAGRMSPTTHGFRFYTKVIDFVSFQ